MVQGRTAHLFDISKQTQCIGIAEAAEGNGLLMSSLNGGDEGLLHSRSTYRVRGRAKPVEAPDALIGFETKHLAVEAIECTETGSGRCQGFPAIRVPASG